MERFLDWSPNFNSFFFSLLQYAFFLYSFEQIIIEHDIFSDIWNKNLLFFYFHRFFFFFFLRLRFNAINLYFTSTMNLLHYFLFVLKYTFLLFLDRSKLLRYISCSTPCFKINVESSPS